MIVDESFDESQIDPFSMVDPEHKEIYEERKSISTNKDTVTINGETFEGRIKTYSVLENRKTKQKVVKVVLVS